MGPACFHCATLLRIKENEAAAPTEVQITDHGDIFKKELVLLKIGEILKTEPTFRKEPNCDKEQVILEK